MQGTSTKLTAGALTSWVVILLSYVAFTATWGPMWAQPPAEVMVAFTASWGPQWATPPAEVIAAFTGLLSAVTAWLVPEKALNPTVTNNEIV